MNKKDLVSANVQIRSMKEESLDAIAGIDSRYLGARLTGISSGKPWLGHEGSKHQRFFSCGSADEHIAVDDKG